MPTGKRLWDVFTIIATVIAFAVDVATLINFINWSQGNLPPPITIGALPDIGIAIPSESVTLLGLLYAFLVFAILSYLKSPKFAYISCATIPLLLLWASVFRQIDDYSAALGILIWADIYFGIFLVDLFIPIRSRRWDKIIETIWRKKIKFLVALAIPGLGLAPITVIWLHYTYGHQWREAILLGFLLGQGGWLLVFCIGLGIVVIYIAVIVFWRRLKRTP